MGEWGCPDCSQLGDSGVWGSGAVLTALSWGAGEFSWVLVCLFNVETVLWSSEALK